MAKGKADELKWIGVDIGKDTCLIVGFGPEGQRVMRTDQAIGAGRPV